MTGWSVSAGPGGGTGWESVGTVDGGSLWARPLGPGVWERPADLVDVQVAREASVTRSMGTVVGPDWEAILPEPDPPQYPRMMLHRPGFRPREMQIDRVEATDDGWKFTMHDPRWTFHGEGKFDDG